MSVCGMDLSVSKKMNRRTQEFNLYLNTLYTACLAYSGIKIIPSLRCGDETTVSLLYRYRHAPMMLLGVHGCSLDEETAAYDEFILRAEILTINPDMLLLYGTPSLHEKAVLDEIGTPYRIYPDFRALTRKGGIKHAGR